MLLTACLIAIGGERWALLDALVTCGCSIFMLAGTLSMAKMAVLAAPQLATAASSEGASSYL